jgi:hypothetical protein
MSVRYINLVTIKKVMKKKRKNKMRRKMKE